MPREEVTITFVEGRTLKEYGALLAERGLVPSVEVWARAVGSVAPRYRVLFPGLFADAPANAGLEGYFFPDTYRFFKNTSARSIIEKALREMDEKLSTEARAKIKEQNKTIFEVLTMASLVEAEGKTAEDRALIADILWRRLRVGMPLQVDSSMGTYKEKGLPAAPINNPSLASINASINPTSNAYWYFISGRDGKMYYARTLDEHNRNIARYLR
ncbi:MAG: Aminodeoxychorismate lyase [Candidatus Magasanikbacteria bacterium GW2011_GWA2_45_39]|uniref:Aminodeoxychorismate lyase n=3 Tax=Candidatus Magasanikiibacteriota TaxID=1752731 RepID=A0A0G1MEZ8_9BACT|nr:MAG: Aminodeoxychorismate lyase [Candidatus Magasanikbacteria bacterium GW2011_GWA2_45_39]